MPSERTAALAVTLLGHASLIVETPDAVIYCDPVLHDPHQEGLFEIHPPRSINAAALPTATHIFVSHQHFDHFDLRSLAAFPRATPVIVPNDDLVATGVRALGFETVERIEDWSRIEIGGTRLCFTRSEYRVPEHGLIVESGGVRLWNQVDTVVSPETVTRVREEIGQIDLLIAPWQPLLDTVVQYNLDYRFPLRRYVDNLVRAARVGAQVTVPGACGFRFAAAWDWQNHLCFPVTRERCVRDLERLRTAPEQRVLTLDPGDRLVLGPAGPELGASGAVTRTQPGATDLLEFDPTLGRFLGTAVFGGDAEADAGTLLSVFEERLEEAFAADPGLAGHFAEWEVVQQIALVGREGRMIVHCDLRGAAPVFGRGGHPLANMHTLVSVDGLSDLAAGRWSWDRLTASGAYRHHRSLFRLTPGGVETPGADLADPLWIAFPYAESLAAKMDGEILRYRAAEPTVGLRERE
ncbi:MAG TPA: MBL fold metallo-hydrolase [Allosphingosinicella sp.]|nr:MBL fold metallo-hydrolase [Allosphingosinicella sp.]